MHIPDRDRCNWLRERIELHEPPAYSAEKKMHILDRLAWSELFEGALCTCHCWLRRNLLPLLRRVNTGEFHRVQIRPHDAGVPGFLANKYAAAKRFGLEGCETLIPGMKAMIDRSAEGGVESICIGMPHRGAFCLQDADVYVQPAFHIGSVSQQRAVSSRSTVRRCASLRQGASTC